MDNCLFIPKAGRKDYALPKSFRPINLSSFLLKTLEKVIDRYIRDVVLARPINYNQSVIDRVEKAQEDKEIALCAFLDIEGAFDSSPTSLLVGGLTPKNVDPTSIRWVKSMLSNRKAKIEPFQTSIEIATTRGCPQGGVLSPLFWTFAS
ncbi:unnamed protein product [Parnassius mnemosyne]|uniref:Reverse transcriptase domain-containing protein n=1 Tax=Parnassius mnemosyne TaxID=213953 RepID=A0AAV1LPQ8_9NEOP